MGRSHGVVVILFYVVLCFSLGDRDVLQMAYKLENILSSLEIPYRRWDYQQVAVAITQPFLWVIEDICNVGSHFCLERTYVHKEERADGKL